ncbi:MULTISPECIES: aromatic amino acid ammonia-lyase [unclassified Streptomyces]|uniref:aromatic amino acid ammonia-lyase n=1 Tax=unclassified Streptomyces TaxID=2593676 RepID=UPI0022542A8F|nr:MULTISPECIES: aromatic amino acid ammonia-lyase [unclassified Streptomyces]MCX4987422.1 aromatic amino acid lyase [Streptomyces sp. NBC_00568]MCX5007445.1 aromatic amino acid lyase [Streptomyces sp. NBC_00638]
MLERTADAATGSAVDEPTGGTTSRGAALHGAALHGRGLDAAAVARIADGATPPPPHPAALEAMERTRRAARRLAAEGTRVYGRSTGVGAHRGLAVEEHDGAGHDLRLLLSHAGGVGEPLPVRQVRAMMVVRANQLLAGGSGLGPEIAVAVMDALRAGVHPRVPEYGSVGTGDLTALAQLGLALFGHGPWLRDRAGSGSRPSERPGSGFALPQSPLPRSPFAESPLPVSMALQRGDALALLSSNALTLGQSALAWHDLGVPLRAAHLVAALSLHAVGGSLEAYAPEVHRAHPHPAIGRAAAQVRGLLGVAAGNGAVVPRPPGGVAARVQDPFGFRCFPQVHGPATEAWSGLERVLSIDLNSATENPLIGWDETTGAPIAQHHGGFFTAPLTLALDQLGLAVLGTARLSTARLSALGRPELTGLRSYLADTSSAGSGMMILEYSAASALAEIQACATPAALGHVVLSQGMEEAATFATQAARKSLRLAQAYRLVLACELVAAVRALRLRGTPPAPDTPAGRAYVRAAAALDPDMRDRPLTDDVTDASALLEGFADLTYDG